MENKKYTFMRDGEPEDVQLERWVWAAIYKDGSYLKQFDDETQVFHQFAEIDTKNLDVFIMQNVQDPNKRYEIHMKPGMTPIHFYRNPVLSAGTPNETRIRYYCFGYQQNIKGENVKVILKIFPDDIVSIESDDGRKM